MEFVSPKLENVATDKDEWSFQFQADPTANTFIPKIVSVTSLSSRADLKFSEGFEDLPKFTPDQQRAVTVIPSTSVGQNEMNSLDSLSTIHAPREANLLFDEASSLEVAKVAHDLIKFIVQTYNIPETEAQSWVTIDPKYKDVSAANHLSPPKIAERKSKSNLSSNQIKTRFCHQRKRSRRASKQNKNSTLLGADFQKETYLEESTKHILANELEILNGDLISIASDDPQIAPEVSLHSVSNISEINLEPCGCEAEPCGCEAELCNQLDCPLASYISPLISNRSVTVVQSKSKRLLLKRESEKKRWKKLKENPERLAEENEKRRVRYAAKKEEKLRVLESKKTTVDGRRRWR
ncbi:hypothetical protein V9T40_010853 [Parthenolecanium corni]|uniref:Uncharacterized protein n=1 Tax=Parthenolecanium corni TaxID=536013 RepID=A0AAN9T4C1_9HEMI